MTTDAPPRHRWAALGVLAAALAMIILDGTIVGVALPAIIDDLDLHLTEAQWVNSLYAMVFAALLLASGRLGDRLGRRRLLVAGIVVFVVGSVLAGLSGGGSPLIASRAVQGVGGALVLPATLSTVNATFRGKDRATAFGVWGAVMSGAFLSFAIVIGEFTMAALLNRPAFGPYMQLLGANRAYEPAALAVIAFAVTWGCMGIMQLISRLFGVRRTAK